MPFSEERRAFLVQALGEEAVAGLEKSTDAMATQLKELGVEYKEAEAEAAKTDETVAQSEGIKALATQIAELSGTVQQLVGVVGAQQKEIAAVKTSQTKTDDEKIEDAFLAKVAKAFGQNGTIVRPTESAKNTKEGEEPAPAQTDFFSSMITNQFASLGPATQGGVGTPAAGTVTVTGGDTVQEVRG